MSESLDWLSRRVEDDPTFLASVLAEYAVSEKLNDVGLAAALGCSRENLTLVRLCRVPRSDPAGLRADTAELAAAYGVDPLRLISVLRRTNSMRAIRAATGLGSLLAARQRSEDEP